MGKSQGETLLTPDEAEAVRRWLGEVFHSDPAETLVEEGWADERIDAVLASLRKKFRIKESF